MNPLNLIILRGNRLRIPFHPTPKGIDYIKKLPFYNYSPKHKHWTIVYQPDIVNDLIEIWKKYGLKIRIEDQRKKTAVKNNVFIPIHQRKCPDEVINKLQELRYSEATLRIYRSMLNSFFTYHYAYRPEEITSNQIRSYLRYLIQKKEVSESYQNQMINAIKFYYEKVLGGARQTYFIQRPRKSRTLPIVLSQEEIKLLLLKSKNLKHKTIIILIYSCGLRISEALKLKLIDIDFSTGRILVQGAKGKKDRYVPLSTILKKYMTVYLKQYNPEFYFIEGQTGGMYSASSIRKFLSKYVSDAGILKKVTPDTLRHSYATHLLENGTDLRFIQHLLGHGSSKTTEIYTHNSGIDNIENPLDRLVRLSKKT